MNDMQAVADMQTPELVALLADLLREKKWMLASAESCTGGLIAGACTEISGSSEWFERGFVTYSNDAKTEMLGIDPALIAEHGAVSEPVARAMVQGAVANSRALVALGVTGVAGPTGGTAEKPVGTVWFGWYVNGQVRSERRRFDGDRSAIRAATVRYALQTLATMIRNFPQ
ncbi:CinA family protein [Variovorax sp. J22R133]|uniref:CinA family protein n=2 Tax=Variovorax brevis TaxID=3053503 RepID=UPI002576A3F7|nr:CinA family protein [Variovorax sp. J22R133]MDM0115588.1 CinA family protein [Variovorax sp. J22R133]